MVVTLPSSVAAWTAREPTVTAPPKTVAPLDTVSASPAPVTGPVKLMPLPLSDKASNITPGDTTSTIAPNLPSPPVGSNANSVDYLRAAQSALQGGRTGEAQQSLEMAQTRLLDRSVVMGQTNNPSENPAVSQISQALKALAHNDRAQTMQLIQSTIPMATASAQ